MYKTSFNTGWVVQPRVGPFEELAGDAPAKMSVTLPHDAMLGSGRSASSPQGFRSRAAHRQVAWSAAHGVALCQGHRRLYH